MSDGRPTQSGRERLPIKLIMPKQGAERRVQGGGGAAVPFRNVDDDFRAGLRRQLNSTRSALVGAFRTLPAVPARVTILKRAIAKSHRPEHLFSEATCPIIGVGRLGELFVKATEKGMANLDRVISTADSDQLIKEISEVESVEPITPAFRRRGLNSEDMLRGSPKDEDRFVVRVQLFGLGGGEDEKLLIRNFETECERAQIPFDRKGYSPENLTCAVRCRTVQEVETVSKIVGVRSMTGMPVIYTGRRTTTRMGAPSFLPRREDTVGEIPVVVVVDSGVSAAIPELQSWVVGQESSVAPQYRNTDHGTFVAALICWGATLNPDLPGIDDGACGVYDLQVIPNSDPARGEIESLLEQEFLETLESALQQHANTYKVWNLSLGTNSVCSLDEFSPLAEELDNLQENYGVSFVISAGNYTVPPLLDFPCTGQQVQAGRITSPADSVLGITVGSISHVDSAPNGPRQNQPAPYSRHGAGPNYVIKPDLVHYGGTCTLAGTDPTGIVSVCDDGLSEDLGTSFATPLVSRTLAQIYHQVTPSPSPVLARALLTHHARDPRTGSRVPDGDEDYFGFGLPSAVPYCIECTPYTSTLVFEDVLRPGFFLEWDDFPYPPSLTTDGKFFGEIWMTVAFAPVRGPRWGSEYCETHIDALFGVFYEQRSRKTGETTTRYKGLVPPEHKNPGMLYETYQIASLRKWAPVRTYHGDLGPNGQRGSRWRLKVQLLTRHDVDIAGDTRRPQLFSLILTIADPLRRAPVYDEMARIISSRFQTRNLSLRSATRVRSSVEE